MSEMVERVARALYDSDADSRAGSDFLTWEYATKHNFLGAIVYRERARAAIAAMREPTEGMLSSHPPYAAYHLEHGAPVFEADLIDHWRAMIDAALNE